MIGKIKKKPGSPPTRTINFKCPGCKPLKVPNVKFNFDVSVQMSRTEHRRLGKVRLG